MTKTCKNTFAIPPPARVKKMVSYKKKCFNLNAYNFHNISYILENVYDITMYFHEHE